MKNVFLCYTPLHILISKRIIEIENLNNNILIFYGIKNRKNLFYFNRFKEFFDNRIFIEKIHNVKSCYNFYLQSYNLQKLGKNINFFCGNIKKTISRLIFFKLNCKSLFTFDDGIGNIMKKGYFYDNNEKVIQKIIFCFLKKHLLYKNIVKDIKLHYTIYTLPNVYSPCKYITLFDRKVISTKYKTKKEITILLTGVFFEDNLLKLNEEIELYKKILKKFNVDYRIPHPREKIKKKKILDSIVKNIESSYIAEEIIFSFFKKYEKVNVIGIYSTTLINLYFLKLKKINLINIDISNISKNFLNLQQFFVKLGITSILI